MGIAESNLPMKNGSWTIDNKVYKSLNTICFDYDSDGQSLSLFFENFGLKIERWPNFDF